MRLTLAAWRRARDITQDEMAKMLGISKPTYVRWEKNPGNITMFNAEKIADIFEVTLTDIIFSA